MWRINAMNHTRKYRNHPVLLFACVIFLIVLLAACGAGGASTNGTNNSGGNAMMGPHQSQNASSQGSGSSSGQGNKSAASYGPQYLIKSLSVNMQVKDTRQVASDLRSWISTTDPRSSSAGIDYEQVGDNLYNVSLSFSVQSTDYDQIEQYLANYAQLHNGKLLSLQQNVQDITNDYIDTQSRLTNLRGEQSRLLTLLSSATTLGDIITVQDKLTDIEGQIENIEAHLKALQGQVTFYTVTINLQPIAPALSTPTPQPTAWNPGQILHDSLATALAVGQALLALLIWLAVFSIYLVPLALIAWFVWRRIHPRQVVAPPIAATTTQTSP